MKDSDREPTSPAVETAGKPGHGDPDSATASQDVPFDPRHRHASEDDAARIEDWVEEGGASSA